MWLPGHIRGHESTDRAAKGAFNMEPTDDLVPLSQLKSLTAKYEVLKTKMG